MVSLSLVRIDKRDAPLGKRGASENRTLVAPAAGTTIL
jgi:hypothetical protein